MKKKYVIVGIRGEPKDFEGLPCPDNPRPDDWKDKASVWVTDNKTKLARVQGHNFAKEIVEALNQRIKQ